MFLENLTVIIWSFSCLQFQNLWSFWKKTKKTDFLKSFQFLENFAVIIWSFSCLQYQNLWSFWNKFKNRFSEKFSIPWEFGCDHLIIFLLTIPKSVIILKNKIQRQIFWKVFCSFRIWLWSFDHFPAYNSKICDHFEKKSETDFLKSFLFLENLTVIIWSFSCL